MPENEELTDKFIQFYRNYYRDEIGRLAQQYPDDQRSLTIHYNDLYQFDTDLAEDYLNLPERMREYAEEALRLYDLPAEVKLGNANVRLTGLPETTSLQKIRSRHVGRFIQIQGTVGSASTVRSEFSGAAFECQRCGTINYIPQSDISPSGEQEEPDVCQGCEKSGPFRVNKDQSELVDTQSIVIEQQIRGEGSDTAIETIEVHLTHDIVGNVSVGDTVSVTGIVRLSDSSSNTTITDKHIDAVWLGEVDPHDHIDITQSDVEQFIEIASRDTVYEDIVGSIAPTIEGYEEEKLALALQLFSGVQKQLPDESTIRGDIHILLVGDPATAKSPLIRSVSRLAPRAVTISGTDTTPVGLTAAATPSSGNADPWEIKGGVLVKANDGLAVIDNIDAFSEEHFQGLHSALEQQEIDVSKATVTRTLPAQTSVVAAANPKYGQFDQYEPIGEQLDLPSEIIPQFDLIFTMIDEPDPDNDRAVAQQVTQNNHIGEIEARRNQIGDIEVDEEDIEEAAEELSPVVSLDLLRKFIVHARQSCYPELTEEAKDAIEEFYVELRSKGANEAAPIPLTARKIEAIVRLAEASARIRLSDTVESEDAERAIDIVRSCLQDIGIDPETGQFDAEVVETGQAQTRRDRLMNMKDLIAEVEKGSDRGAPIEKILDRANEIGMDRTKAEQEIEKLRRKGEVFEPKEDCLMTT